MTAASSQPLSVAPLTTLTIDPRQMALLRELLAAVPAQMPKILYRILKGTGRAVNTRTLRVLAKATGISQEKLRGGSRRYGGVRWKQPSVSNLETQVNITGKRLPLSRFRARQTRAGVSYSGAAPMKGRAAGAFLAPTIAGDGESGELSGHIGAFMRIGPKVLMRKGRYAGQMRQKILQLYGPSLPQIALHDPELARMLDVDAGPILEKQTASQIDWLLAKGKPGPDSDTGGAE